MARRWIPTVVVIGVVAIVGVNLWRLWVMATADPVAVGRFAPTIAIGAPGSDRVDPRVEPPHAVALFDYRPGEGLLYGFGLVNRGSRGITVTGIEAYPHDTPLLAMPDEVEVCGGPGQECRPLEPFPLAAGEERFVEIRSGFANCERYPSGSVTRVDRFLVEFEVMGLPASSVLELDEVLVVETPEACP